MHVMLEILCVNYLMRLHSCLSVIEFRHYLVFRTFRVVFLDKVICSFILRAALLAAPLAAFPLRFRLSPTESSRCVVSFALLRSFLNFRRFFWYSAEEVMITPSRTFNLTPQLRRTPVVRGFLCIPNIIFRSSFVFRKMSEDSHGCYSLFIWEILAGIFNRYRLTMFEKGNCFLLSIRELYRVNCITWLI